MKGPLISSHKSNVFIDIKRTKWYSRCIGRGAIHLIHVPTRWLFALELDLTGSNYNRLLNEAALQRQFAHADWSESHFERIKILLVTENCIWTNVLICYTTSFDATAIYIFLNSHCTWKYKPMSLFKALHVVNTHTDSFWWSGNSKRFDLWNTIFIFVHQLIHHNICMWMLGIVCFASVLSRKHVWLLFAHYYVQEVELMCQSYWTQMYWVIRNEWQMLTINSKHKLFNKRPERYLLGARLMLMFLLSELG